ncbi:MAG: hypothetical protein QOD06_2722, partial [Candidatus Binatota bacterium]|nr:hypothetical protein [Candidatus Binatota bacterium]
ESRARRPERRAASPLERHRYAPLVTRLCDRPSFVARSMFGCVGCYVDGRLVLVLADRKDPWRGFLLPTEREVHADLLAAYASLRVHPVLGKWLYLPDGDDSFAETADAIVGAIAGGDARFGVEPETPRLPHRR